MERIERVDKNGTKYMVDDTCPKCGGSGYISAYGHIYSGVCFRCGGSGVYEHRWKEYTPEYAETLRLKRLAKAQKSAPERNAKKWAGIGLAEDGSAWIVANKFAKSADMKPLGARWNPELGWFFKTEHDGTFFMSAEDLGHTYEDGTWAFKEDIYSIIDAKREELLPKTDGEFIGEVGKKLSVEAVFEKEFSFESCFGWTTTTVYVLKFKVGNNTVVWKTSTYNALEEGKTYTVSGTIKEHKEYRGDKQTVLTRCKVVAA